MTKTLAALLNSAQRTLNDACATDDLLWEERATGQDTEEAEASGYLAGYRDALSVVARALNGDEQPLRDYLGVVRVDMREAEAELATPVA